jgi:hypothetical protein
MWDLTEAPVPGNLFSGLMQTLLVKDSISSGVMWGISTGRQLEGTPVHNYSYELPPYWYSEFMSKRAVDTVFQAMFTLTDLRVLLRETAPSHELDSEQRTLVAILLADLESQVKILQEELIQ